MTRFLAWFIATYSGILTSISSTACAWAKTQDPDGPASSYYGTLLYQMTDAHACQVRSFGIQFNSPEYCRRKVTRPVSYYAFFK